MIRWRTMPAVAALAALAGLAGVLPAGCADDHPGTVIARVGDSTLTMEQAHAALDSTADGFEGRLGRYVDSWVNSELLHQEALRLGIDEDPEFTARVEAMRRQLANQEVLDRLVYSDTTAFPDSVLQEYLARHPDEFSIDEDHLKLRVATFRTREGARRFAISATPGALWNRALDSITNNPRTAGELLAAEPERWYTRSTLYPPELWKLASQLSTGEASFPFKTAAGYTVLQHLGSVPAGKTTEFDVVRDEVRTRVLIEHRRSRLEALLGTLRERYNVEISMHVNP